MKTLLIEDNEDHVVLIQEALYQAFSEKTSLITENRMDAGVRRLSEEEFDVCLFDLSLPDSSSEDTVEILKRIKTPTPIVVLTALDDISIAKSLVQTGIQDYLPKNELTGSLLYRVIHYAMDRKKQQLLLEEKNLDMQAFCHSLSHDFKAHLRRMVHLLDFFREDIAHRITLNDEENKMLSQAQGCAKDIMSLVESLHGYLSIDSLERKSNTFSLEKLIEKVEATLHESLDKDFKLALSALPEIEALESQIFLVFQNLMINAVTYNNNSPEINITAELDSDNAKCKIYVRDNGIGIEDKYLDRIFQPFSRLTNEYSGSGLGLSIVKRIIEKHRGSITVESEMGVGSCFVITLPLAQG